MRAFLPAALLYGALALVAQRSLLPGLGDRVYFQELPAGNDCLLHVWTLAWDHHALATQPCDVYDANVFYPQEHTLLYSDHLLGLAALLAPLRLATDNVVLIHNLATVAAPALDALALYALADELTGSSAAALVGGLLYGFAPVRFGPDRCQLQMLVGWWLPLLFLFGRRALVQNRVAPGLLAAAALLLQGLTGIYLTAFVLPFLALAHLAWLRRFPPARHRRGWTALVAAEAAAALVLLPSALAFRHVQQSLAASRSVVLNALLSLQPATLPTYLPVMSAGVLFALGALARRRLPEAFRAERPLFIGITVGAFLFAFGPAIPLPAELGQIRGPYAALLAVPGYDALRAPGRMLHLVLLGASVIAAGGVAALTAALPRATAATVTVAMLTAVALECRTPHLATIPAPPPAEMDRSYAWVAAQPDDFRFVEIPVHYYGSDTRYQYASTGHWKKMLNGNMGLLPPVHPYLVHKLLRFPDPDVLGALRAVGITHALVHVTQILQPVQARLARLRTDPGPLTIRYDDGDSIVFEIPAGLPAPRPLLRGGALPREGWRLTASQGQARTPRAVDGDPATSWSSWGDLEDHLGHWYAPTRFLDLWNAFVAAGRVRFEVDLGAPAAVTGVLVRLGGSDPMAPAQLVLELSADGTSWTTAPGDFDPVPDVRAVVTAAAEGRFALALPAATRARFVRLSCPGFEWRIGDLQVYAE